MRDPIGPQDQPTESIQSLGAGAARPAMPLSPSGSVEGPGDTIGPYRVLQIIGEGGFGVVYLAERREPMVQRVALKIIKPGMDSRAVVARFERERQALAVMDHRNVARVFDGGVTDKGRPYFVMEYVKGEPITAFADRQRLTIRQRLELFTSVCDAVQHAHMKGIIHRDIKPSNILVAHTGEGDSHVVKVIDFGVAKAISHSLTDKTIFTERGQIIGTPEYMSPEQAEMGATDIDTRTDVYSLGVVLYELLSGTLPFDAKTLRAAGYAEIQRIIREVEAPRPSTKLSTADDRTGAAIAQSRQADRERIASELRRELEWIPLKALRKDRSRRYASAESLGADVQRYLDGKPLEAAPESRTYLARKFVRRNRVQVTAVAAVAIALVAGFGTALWQASEAASERDAALLARQNESEQRAEAERQRLRADERAATAEDVIDFLDRDFLRQASLRENPDPNLKFINVVERAASRLDGRFEDRPEVEARIRLVLGTVFADAGRAVDAELMLERARKLVERSIGSDSVHMADVLHAMAWSRGITSELEAATRAAALCRQAGEIYKRLVGAKDARSSVCAGDEAMFEALGAGHKSALFQPAALGMVAAVRGRGETIEQIETKFRVMIAELQRYGVTGERDRAMLLIDTELEPFLRSTLLRSRVPITLSGVGTECAILGFEHASRFFLEKGVELSRQLLPPDHRDTITIINNMGVILREQGKLVEAEPYLREALEMARRVKGEEDQTTLTCLVNLSVLFDAQGKHQEAVDLLAPAEPAARRTLTSVNAPNLATFLIALGNARGNLARNAGGFTLGESNLLEGHRILIASKDRGPSHKDTLKCVHALVDFYAAWHAAEPGKGYDGKATEWRSKLPPTEAADADPATSEPTSATPPHR